MIALALLGALCVFICISCLWLRHRHSYWRARKVRGPVPQIPFGNCTWSILGRKSVQDDFFDLYQQYKHEPYVGLFFAHTPLLQIHDLDIIKEVMVKQFHDFNGRGIHSDPERDPITGHLFILSGQPWRNMRVKLSPTFTSGKIKYYFRRVQECAVNLQEHLDNMIAAGGGSYQDDARELFARYSTDIIASLIFGIDSNSIQNPDSELRSMGRRTMEPSSLQGLRLIMQFFAKDIMKTFRIRLLDREIEEFFHRVVNETVEFRESRGVERADLLNLLIQLKNKGFLPPDSKTSNESSDESSAHPQGIQKLTMGQIIAQVFVFYIGGFETTSSTISYALYELAKNPSVMQKATQEIDKVIEKHKGEITFECINSLPYLDQVVQETLRLYPPVPFLSREAMRTRTLPNSSLTLEKGQCLIIPVNAIQKDPDLWPDPLTFDPERFSEENKSSIHPMSFLGFGDGPRICIGMRLGMVQVKVALAATLSRFKVSRCPDTPDEIVIAPYSIVPAPVGGIPLTLSRRDDPSAL